MASPYDPQLIQQLQQYAQNLNTGQAAGIGNIGQYFQSLQTPMDDLNAMSQRMGIGAQPLGAQLPTPPLALNAGPQASNMGARFAAGASGGIDDLAAQVAGMGGGGGTGVGGGMGGLIPKALGPGVTAAEEGAGGLLSQLGGLGGGFRNPLAAGGGIGGLAKAALPGLGISVGGNYIGNQIGGGVGDFISGASTGAGLGLMFGVPGAVAGGVLGGALSLFGDHGDDTSPQDKLKSFAEQAGMSDEMSKGYLLQYEILKSTTGDEKAALQTVGQQIVTDMANKEAAGQEQQKLLASQALTAQFFQPFTQQILDSAQQRASVGEQLASKLPEGFKQIAQMGNAASLDNATRTANAYAAQLQQIPAFEAMQQQQQMANQIAQQQAAQVMAQVSGAGAAGVGDNGLAGLIAQLQGQ